MRRGEPQRGAELAAAPVDRGEVINSGLLVRKSLQKAEEALEMRDLAHGILLA